MAQIDGSDFYKLAESINRGIPEQTSNATDKRRALEGKKRLLNHPACPPDVKSELLKEIAILKQEIQKAEEKEKAEKHENVINTSFFSKRNIG